MDIAGNLAQSIGQGIAGLVGGALGALGTATQGVVNAFQSILPGPWLPIAAVAVIALFVRTVYKR